MLIGFRVLQGLGGGMLMPLGMTIMTKAAGPKRMGRLMAILGVPMLLGPILGPILGGWLIDSASWHWVFLINVPIGAVALIGAYAVVQDPEYLKRERTALLGKPQDDEHAQAMLAQLSGRVHQVSTRFALGRRCAAQPGGL